MNRLPAPPLRKGELQDADAIAALVNMAFLTESFFIKGDRTHPDEIRALLQKGEFILLEENAAVLACVYVELRGERGYFGLLAVEPEHQGKGLALRLITEAEAQCRAAGCCEMELLIVNLREELPRFYQRLGYRETGIEPFPPKDGLKLPCHFVKMTKPL